MTGITMSAKELSRLSILEQRRREEISQTEAARHLGLTVRHLRRVEARCRAEGVNGLVHQGRGKCRGRRIAEEGLGELCGLLDNASYGDYGPTLLTEELTRKGHKLSRETVRQEMIKKGKWQVGQAPVARVHLQRLPMARRGQLTQADGSKHAWFEERGPECTLLVAIDGATSNIEALRFVPNENGVGYRELFMQCFERHGVPRAVYTDRHAIFKVNHPMH